MTTREELIWTCDLCNKVADVETHEVILDGVTIELEACERCWTKPAAAVDRLAKAGRVTGRRRRRKVR